MAIPSTNTILESVSCMVPKPTIPEADAIQQILTRHLQAVMRGTADAQAELDSAAVEIGERLGERVRLRFPPER